MKLSKKREDICNELAFCVNMHGVILNSYYG